METEKQVSIVQKAKQYAIECHTGTNHKYGKDMPYSFHLTMVVNAAMNFIHLIPESEQENVLAGCWLHDTIEDCRITYNDVKKETNESVAELVYALTNEKGKNRKERANDKYYEGIRSTPYATFIKLCDRIANVEYSYATESRMFELYCKENDEFVSKVWDDSVVSEQSPNYKDMVDYLKGLCLNYK